MALGTKLTWHGRGRPAGLPLGNPPGVLTVSFPDYSSQPSRSESEEGVIIVGRILCVTDIVLVFRTYNIQEALNAYCACTQPAL